jgi:hypothetical protein
MLHSFLAGFIFRDCNIKHYSSFSLMLSFGVDLEERSFIPETERCFAAAAIQLSLMLQQNVHRI